MLHPRASGGILPRLFGFRGLVFLTRKVAEIFADDIENEQSATNAAQGCNPNSVKQLTARTVRP
ncbi:MAG: hypothetical protein CFE30_32130 [Bradyrhizobium sp. PARBB1]|nr:MAG: hypothetical protein CFE30_32130 [Bradyrhizobium sp. PARBB1]PSO14652.1 hypothetical protein C7G43_34680 [Bradyrhizobium sp. MOS004]HAQ84679.1 hypothetical protein [Bradyrhizobium sp.]HAR17563.1 hypothetical protein [Bradyrhizobium sp.]HAR25003.1 hypothetical protein [Bradyrhizobium sp.]